MLVLTRKVGEKIVLGSEITLTVVEVTRNRVKLGIDAPAEVHITRAELAPLLTGTEAETTASPSAGPL